MVWTRFQFKFDNLKIVLIGTKADLKDEAQAAPISKAEGDQLAGEINAVGYLETSSKTGVGIKEAIEKGLEAAMLPNPPPSMFECKNCCRII